MNDSYRLAVDSDETNRHKSAKTDDAESKGNASKMPASASSAADQKTNNNATPEPTSVLIRPRKSLSTSFRSGTTNEKSNDDDLRRLTIRAAAAAASSDQFLPNGSSSIRFAASAGQSTHATLSLIGTSSSPVSRRQHRHSNRVQRQTSNIFAMLSQDQIEELKEAFTIFDQDRDGIISRNDLKTLLRSLGKVPDEEFLDQMLQDAMQSNINFTMFLTLFGQKMQGTDSEETIKQALQCLIATLEPHELPLTVSKLRELLTTCGVRDMRLDDTQVDELFQHAFQPVLISAHHQAQAAAQHRESSEGGVLGGDSSLEMKALFERHQKRKSEAAQRLSDISGGSWADVVEVEPANFAHFLKTGFMFPDFEKQHQTGDADEISDEDEGESLLT